MFYRQSSPMGSPVDSAHEEVNMVLGTLGGMIAPGAMSLMQNLTAIAITILGWFATILEVFFRYDFGERYLSVTRIVLAGLPLFSVWFIPNAFGFRGTSPATLLFLVYLALAAQQRWRIWVRTQKRIPWHSMSFGISRLEVLPLPGLGAYADWALYRWYEPALGLIIAYVVAQIDAFAGVILSISAFSLFLRNQMVFFQFRGRVLDLIDARLEAMYFNEQAMNKPKTETAGIAVVKAVWPNIPHDPGDLTQTVSTTMSGGLVRPIVESTAPEGGVPQTQNNDDDFSKTISDALGGVDSDQASTKE